MNRIFYYSFNFLLLLSIFLVFSTSPASAEENLYVSKDIADKNFLKNFPLESDSEFAFVDGCTSFVSENYHRVSYSRYIDQISPTFDVGFYNDEYPITIDSTIFSKSDFFGKSKTVMLKTKQPIILEINLFENRGPQNIENVTLYADLQNSLEKENTPYISLTKNPPSPVSDPIFNYIKGQIEEDFGQSYRYGEPWASYSVVTYDPEKIFGNVTAKYSKQNHKLQTSFELSFLKTIPKSNLILTSSDLKGNTLTCYILDAWQVNSQNNFPFWFETTLMWNKQGLISDEELVKAQQYFKQ